MKGYVSTVFEECEDGYFYIDGLDNKVRSFKVTADSLMLYGYFDYHGYLLYEKLEKQ
ncbi:MAG: hypothetical protein FWD66_03745 [Paludibacter sp.]|nr:hypothetical protein [Paludibacter sp.]